MKHEIYLKKAEGAEIRINGLSGTTQITKRPKLRRLKAILKDRILGTVTFQDVFFTEVTKEIVVSEGQLFYDGEFIATHKIPDLYMIAGDTLTWKYTLTITTSPRGFLVSI